MKRTTVMLFIMLLFVTAALLCTCNADKASTETLVSVTFGDGSRALEAQLEPFVKDALYWKYAARKSLATDGESTLDGSGLRSGETEAYDEAHALPVTANGAPGLDAKIPGFSQGLWDFMLFGYSTRTGSGTAEDPYVYSKLVYSGEAKEQSLKKDSNAVSVTVSPVQDHGNGTLFVDTANITFIPVQTETTGVSTTFEKRVFIDGVLSEETTVSIAHGAHQVKVQIVHTYSSVDYVVAEGSVTATVFSNLKTTVSGSLNELVTYAQFDATESYPASPKGTIEAVQDTTTKVWTVTLTSTNPDSVPTSYVWYVDDELQDETTNVFTYTPEPESVNITCVFGNTSGTGSASVYIK